MPQRSMRFLQNFDKDLVIGGLLLNKVGGHAHLVWLQEAMEAAGVTAPVLGGLPKVCRAYERIWHLMADRQWVGLTPMTWWYTGAQDDKVVMKERYLGLHAPGDDGVPLDVIANLATLVETHCDLDAIFEVCLKLFTCPCVICGNLLLLQIDAVVHGVRSPYAKFARVIGAGCLLSSDAVSDVIHAA